MVLNVPQRRVLAVLEQQRLAGEPLRLVLLKARQWGGSTLVQIYMAWIQLVLKTNWNSLICGHLRQTSAALKGMYTRALRNYPKHLARDGNRPVLKTYEGLRLPSSALRMDEDGVLGVYCVAGITARFKPVTVVYRGDGYTLVQPLPDAPAASQLRRGDEVIITAARLENGVVVR